MGTEGLGWTEPRSNHTRHALPAGELLQNVAERAAQGRSGHR